MGFKMQSRPLQFSFDAGETQLLQIMGTKSLNDIKRVRRVKDGFLGIHVLECQRLCSPISINFVSNINFLLTLMLL